jgi:hypothetical protein
MRYDIHQTSVQMIMAVHLQELRREGQPAMTYADLEDYLADSLWKRKTPRSLSEAADDILKITSDDVIRFLAQRAAVKGASGNLADFTDLIGGTK